jgi:hypothetical protein
VSVFGNKDSYGDVVMPGAFADSLAAWKASGNPIPVYYSHRMDDPDFNIGYVLDAEETDKGLQVHAKLDLDDDAKKAKQVYRLLKGGGSPSSRSRTTSKRPPGSRPRTTGGTSCASSACTRSARPRSAPTRRPSCSP